MRKDPADPSRPLVGTQSKCLGVRTHGKYSDIDIDSTGIVELNRKGLSVSSTWRILAPHLIPEELDDGLIGASGKGMEVFVLGSGPFIEGPVTVALELCLKPWTSESGNICPIVSVEISQYQADLAATRSNWIIDPS